MKKFFVNIDGPDGSGKTGLSKKLYDRLKGLGYQTTLTAEPGGTNVGKKIKKLILQNEMSQLAETLLFFADRAEHFEKVIKDTDGIIICDRFVDSTKVYQHKIGGVDWSIISQLMEWTTNYFVPDINFTIVSDKPHGKKENDKYDQAGLEFRNKVMEEYLEIANERINHLTEYSEQDTFIINTTPEDWDECVDYMIEKIIRLL